MMVTAFTMLISAQGVGYCFDSPCDQKCRLYNHLSRNWAGHWCFHQFSLQHMHKIHRSSFLTHSPRLFLAHRLKHWSRSLFKVDESSEKHGGDLVAKTLKSHGVQEVFTLCGGHITPILVGCESLGIRVVDTRHEVTTVFAADAVSRLRQDLGVAAVTSGPGVTNTVTAMKNAQMAESALLLLGGAAPTTMQHRGALQDIDQLSIFKPVCKHTARVTRVRDIIPTLKESIQIAKSGTPGPVFVEIPIDLLYPYEQAFRDAIIKRPANLTQKIYNEYVRARINYEFHNGFTNQDTTPLSLTIPTAKNGEVKKVADLIKSSKKPLLLLGSQATLGPVSAHELQKIVNDLGIPCYLGGMCRGLLGLGSPIQLRQNRRGALKEADLVILAGTPADFRLDYGKILSPNSKVVAINRSADNLKKVREDF
uniref:IlvB-like protein n=1 Tax=Bursaphelenchus xylophilus TaxID=6326 RepID=A0A1I7SBM5_BURXY